MERYWRHLPNAGISGTRESEGNFVVNDAVFLMQSEDQDGFFHATPSDMAMALNETGQLSGGTSAVSGVQIVANQLQLVDGNGDPVGAAVDLAPYLDDTNLARLVSGTLDAATGIVTVTRDDASTFTIDMSALLASDTWQTLAGPSQVESGDFVIIDGPPAFVAAVTAATVNDGERVTASDTSLRYINNSGAAIVLTGDTEADLIADGLVLDAISLPASPSDGDQVKFAPGNHDWGLIAAQFDTPGATTFMDGQSSLTAGTDVLTAVYDQANDNWKGFVGGATGGNFIYSDLARFGISRPYNETGSQAPTSTTSVQMDFSLGTVAPNVGGGFVLAGDGLSIIAQKDGAYDLSFSINGRDNGGTASRMIADFLLDGVLVQKCLSTPSTSGGFSIGFRTEISVTAGQVITVELSTSDSETMRAEGFDLYLAEVATQSAIPASDVPVSNNGTATNRSILMSNGDQTATFSAPNSTEYRAFNSDTTPNYNFGNDIANVINLDSEDVTAFMFKNPEGGYEFAEDGVYSLVFQGRVTSPAQRALFTFGFNPPSGSIIYSNPVYIRNSGSAGPITHFNVSYALHASAGERVELIVRKLPEVAGELAYVDPVNPASAGTVQFRCVKIL